MKLNIKPKAEKRDVWSTRLRVSLIKRLKDLAVRADKVDMDFAGTVDDLMEAVADEFEARVKEKEQSVYKTYTEAPPQPYTNGR